MGFWSNLGSRLSRYGSSSDVPTATISAEEKAKVTQAELAVLNANVEGPKKRSTTKPKTTAKVGKKGTAKPQVAKPTAKKAVKATPAKKTVTKKVAAPKKTAKASK